MTYGEHAKAARVAVGLNMSELERRSGVPRGCIHRLEYDLNMPEIQNLLKICKVLNMTPEMYLCGKERPRWYRYREPDWRRTMKFHRMHAGLDKVELADRACVTDNTISHLENGTRHTYTRVVILLAEALGIGLDEYLGFK